ncbi:MAG: hypothetical protein E7215_07580 [Clostridium sulfidigenes]|uniref:Uncharacterized protein n=1 Tax=Clostridium sulfidigenes TaxID=318464 RepID=A0A927W809_9CLOT|nr:hypothetical protein [Clostridium sulfidigenes]
MKLKALSKNKRYGYSSENSKCIRKSLVMTKCSECGKIAIVPLKVKDNKVIVHGNLVCLNCGNKLQTDNLSRGEGKCADCGSRIYFYAQGTQDFEIHCQQCSSPIDLMYNAGKQQFRSANLFGSRKRKHKK